jgi:hypothetical protein
MARVSRISPEDLRRFATREVGPHSRDFSRALAARFGVTRAGAAPLVRRLEREGFLLRSSGGTRPIFLPGPSRLLEEQLALPGVDESLLWEQAFAPWFSLTENVANIAHYAFTEMVNNANDHSAAHRLLVRGMQTANTWCLIVRDDGVGAFRRIAQALRLEDERLAVLELVKGKFSSDPARHTGEGVFFTSRAVDLFLLRANGLEYRRQDGRLPATQRHLWADLAGWPEAGTVVVMALALGTTRQLREVFDAYTTRAPEDHQFDRTVVPVSLARLGNENLLSRSQAKRLMARFERFRRVELDFAGVPEIGQAFADELFRVFAAAHPQVELLWSNAAPQVRSMIDRARSARGPST